eukprot:1671303-Rhodomonas_salina.1
MIERQTFAVHDVRPLSVRRGESDLRNTSRHNCEVVSRLERLLHTFPGPDAQTSQNKPLREAGAPPPHHTDTGTGGDRSTRNARCPVMT